MDKKTALKTLLETSFWVTDPVKKEILSRMDTLTEKDIDILGKFWAKEREIVLQNKEKILEESEKLLRSITP